ncbi:DUF3164 family protein [Sulfurospirillum cavolei]|uniref:DUF3164 family protein n=1 Tax=Sulfurospirillum cavolei TaxID=366522 RepID=UPI000764B2B9|nr:DUF3164 family protein [Sulfurospirillum cavolei]
MVLNEQGAWRDKEGNYKHPDLVPVDKQLEDELVMKLVSDAKAVNETLAQFKASAFEQCYAFVDILRQKYGLNRLEKSESGSVTLRAYDGTAEVQIQVAKLIVFDAKLKLAKEKLDEYFTEKTEDSDPEIKTLILRAFEVRNGKVDAKQILSLKSYPITHPKWREAMVMIDDATEIAGTKSYIRFKERKDGLIDGDMVAIPLDLASVEIPKKD